MEKDSRAINIGDVVKYLSRAFSKATAKASSVIGTRATRTKKHNNVTTTLLYDYQVEFCHLINDIQHGPKYIATKGIQRANELISEIEAKSN